MTVPQSCKSARYARWLSTGHGRARPAVCPPPQIVQQSIEFDAIRRSLLSRSTVEQLVASAPFKSVSSPAALKSP
jgi:hypothetical protein